MGRRTITPLLCLAATLTAALPAWAQQSEDALLTECYTLRRQNRNADAVERCQQAVTLTRSARALAQLAITEIALERWTDAATHMAAALADRVHPWVQQNRATLDEAMATIRPRVGELHVDGGEAGATVLVNGRGVGALPLSGPVFLMPGAVLLEVRAGDQRVVSRSVTVTAGRTLRESIVFPAATTAVATTAQGPTPIAPRQIPAAGSLQRTLGWTVAGGALVGFGFAIAAWRVREGVVSDYTAVCPTGEVDDATAARCAGLHTQANSDIGTWEALTTVGLVSGGVLAVASAVLFATSPSSQAGGRSSFGCGSGPGTLGMQCAVSF